MSATSAASQRQLRGDLAVWVLILAELLVFGVFFLAYVLAFHSHVSLFRAGQASLSIPAATFNTLALISASALVVQAIAALRAGHLARAGWWFALAAGLGMLFLGNKGLELHHHLQAGISLSTNLFYMFYLGLVFFHFMHVVAGVLILAWMSYRCFQPQPPGLNAAWSAGAYWHMVDLVWVVLFPLVYLL